ncbi:helix-turn-helix domain-containing protein [Pseudodonghicola flavimaris]|uniref:Helix-turn-helix domain-containing protein n=1 Tax=Pseudodonghicola flavimaris TaxID=3050036 RepID=A0ABT7F574_9RHOB|nr:helix-turn-helix domain-containing protein [Pseudodonghicola flavimaris]MDK3019763.1 helix-turn-helix domain-containing protein [Pseudodonghicola flavimaris]
MLTQLKPEVMPFDQFAASLQSVCGAFEMFPADGRETVRGHISRETYAGLEMAMIGKDVQRVRRTEADIQAKPGEHVFLIIQEEGQALMQQAGTSTLMGPGDMILIDSTVPSEFTFFGKYMRHLSIHLDRCEMLDRFGGMDFSGRSIRQESLSARALSALIASAFEEGASERRSSFLKDAIFGVLGAVLCEAPVRPEGQPADADLFNRQLLEMAMASIDHGFANSAMSPGHLAEELGVPIRTLQRAFACAGMTPTDYLLRRRLERACQLLIERCRAGSKRLVSTIAYECGFNDVSYFNRQFRRAFGCSPGQYPQGSADANA